MARIRRPIAILALFGLSFVLRLWMALALRFDGLYGQDAYAYFSYGQQIRAAVARFQLPGHFYWPLGYPALAALSFTLLGEQPLGPQLVSLFAGAATSVLAYLIAVTAAHSLRNRHPALPRLAGLVAWAIVSVCGQLNQSSIVIMSDAPALMWASLSAWALLVYGRSRRLGWIVLAAFALAWATMTRWQYAGLALPWALFVLLNRPIRWRHALWAFVVSLLTMVPQIAHSLQNRDLPISHEWVQGWSSANFFARDFVTPDGTFHYTQSPAEYYAQPLYNPYYMGSLFAPLIVVGLLCLILPTAVRPVLALLIGWLASQYGFLMGIPYENIRFALALVPPLAVLAGIGAAWLLTRRRVPQILRAALLLLMIQGLINTLRVSAPIITEFVSRKNADLDAVRWLERQVAAPNATVFCIDLMLTIDHYSALHPVQIYEQTPDSLRPQIRYPAYAIFNVWTIDHQWVGKSPWKIYYWLRDQVGMTQIGTFGLYTLYRITP